MQLKAAFMRKFKMKNKSEIEKMAEARVLLIAARDILETAFRKMRECGMSSDIHHNTCYLIDSQIAWLITKGNDKT